MNNRILWEDEQVLVCYKPAGLAVQSSAAGRMDMESELKNYLADKGRSNPYLGVIHRLDQPVEGILVFAKDSETAAVLNRQLAEGKIRKKYYAVVKGELPDGGMDLKDYLVKDVRSQTARITGAKTAGAKRAVLFCKKAGYEEAQRISLADIEIQTGRFHQIRAQMANAGFPLLGDRKYGTDESRKQSDELKIKNTALCACFLEFVHPKNQEKVSFRIFPENTAFLNFKQILEK